MGTVPKKVPEPVPEHTSGSPSTLVVSPHLDDAMLSTASFLLGPRTTATTVLTVFAGPPPDGTAAGDWDRACGFATAAAALEARLAEDDEAFAGLPVDRHHLPLADGAYGERDSPAERVVRRWVRQWAQSQPGPVRVLVPAGAGVPHPGAAGLRPSDRPGPPGWRRRVPSWIARPAQAAKHQLFVNRKRRAQSDGMLAHLDHLLVRDAVLAELVPDRSDERVTLGCYEELPYLWARPGDRAVGALAARSGLTAQLEARPVDTVAKATRLAAYGSQIGVLDPAGRLADPSTLPAVERCWWLRAPRRPRR